MNRKRISIVVALLLMLLVLPIQNSTSFFVDNEDVDCNWSCWGGNPSHTFSVSKECAPDLKNMKLLWKKNYKEQIGQHFFSNGYLYLISINNLRCIDAKNGELKWIKEDAEYRLVTIYKNNCLTISIKDGEGIMEFINILSCFDAASGELKWETVMSEDSCYSVPWLFTDGELVFTYNKSGVMASRNIPWLMNQYSLETGELIHSEKRDEHSIPGILFDNSLIISSVINYGYTIYAERILASYSINEHSINWETKAKGDGYSFVNVPILYSGYIYVLSSKGYQNNRTSAKLNCINPEDGSHIWDIEIPKESWRLMSVSSGMVIIADNEKMYCYDLLSKKEVWSVINNETFFYIAISDNKLFCFDCPEKYGTEKKIICYDLNDGNVLWQEDCDDATVNQIVIADKKLLYSTKSGSYANGETNLYCWGTPSSPKGSVHRITISPTSILINHNETYQFKAIVYDSSDNKLPEKIAWSVDPKSAGTITQDGLFTPGKRADKCVIKAESGGKVAFALVTIIQAVRIKIEPSYIDIRPGEKVKFMAVILDSKGKGIIGVPKMWSLSDPKLGEISPLGEFTAGETGGISGNVFCTFGNIKGKAKINIINVNMENAVSFERGTINFGEIVSGHEKTLEIILKGVRLL